MINLELLAHQVSEAGGRLIDIKPIASDEHYIANVEPLTEKAIKSELISAFESCGFHVDFDQWINEPDSVYDKAFPEKFKPHYRFFVISNE